MTSAVEQRTTTSWWQAVVAGLVTFVLIVAAGLVAALVVVPKVMHGMSLTVLTGSMEPNIDPGDVVVTRGVDVASAANLRIGDVITFLPYPDDPTLVTHRITGKSINSSGTWFITQGDNNNALDSWGPVGDFQVRGVVAYVIPKVGWVREWTGQTGTWVLPALGAVLIVAGIVGFVTAPRRAREDESDDDSAFLPARRGEGVSH